MRAGRLVALMLILQRRGRVTAAYLAVELEVSERTVLRDIEELSGAGVPVYATRGPGGGFQLLANDLPELTDPNEWRPVARRPGRRRRAQIRISPEGLRLAAVLQRLQPIRVGRSQDSSDDGWLTASFRLETIDAAVIDLLSLGPTIRVTEPVELRDRVADSARRITLLYPDTVAPKMPDL
jgi:predicted DNA-binding transcriptional regulator YafY